jgi:hypothetical protein
MRVCALRPMFATVVASFVALISFAALADPPGRVARLAEYAGDVRITTAAQDWQPVYRNHVVTAGDNLWVSDGGRAELDVGALQVWLGGGANVYFERFDDDNLVARLGSGMLAVRIRQWEQKDAMRIATEHGEISFVRPGLYFVVAGERGNPSIVTTRFGQAELETFGRTQRINSGDTVAFDQSGARFDRFAYAGTPSGGFEAWVSSRDRRIERWEARNRGNFNPWMVGVRDLDDHGYWESSYEYGRVWYPRAVSDDWAPYRNGRWSWVQPWGWTWIDDAPWGFAPFHYGRWVRLGGRWAWYPGSYVGRPVYAPALVSFYGGNGWSVNVSVGPTYSWVPLGWNEPYVPWYTYSTNYWRHVNRPYVRNAAEDPWRPPGYIHARVPGAVTTVAVASLVAGRHISQNYVRNLPTPDLRSAPPARMGEVVPQFVARGSNGDRGVGVGRGSNGDRGVAIGRDSNGTPPIRGGVSESAPLRGAPPTTVRERAPAPIQPNVNVAEPRVWQDPNPISPRASVREGPPNTPRDLPERRVAPEPRSLPSEPGNRGAAPFVQERGAPPAIQNRVAPPQERSVPAQPMNPARPDKGAAPVSELRRGGTVPLVNAAPAPTAVTSPARVPQEKIRAERSAIAAKTNEVQNARALQQQERVAEQQRREAVRAEARQVKLARREEAAQERREAPQQAKQKEQKDQKERKERPQQREQ